MLRRFLLASISALGFAVATAGPAAADPASMIITALGGAAAIGTAGVIAVQLTVGLALSYVSQALAKQQAKQDQPGIRTQSRTEGGTLPQTRILGRYATAGNVAMPYYTAGESDGTDNAYLYMVHDLADHKITALRAFWVNGKKFSDGNLVGSWSDSLGRYPDPSFPSHDDWIHTADGVNYPQIAVRFRDGSQGPGGADPTLLNVAGSHPKRPFTADMYGRGIAYARTRARYDPELFQGEPEMMFEVDGEALYDRRSDTTDGGSGTQRAGNESTWAHTLNPLVMVENILRGLPLDEGGVWGLGVTTENLPRSAWVQAMDYCDQSVNGAPRFRAGYEIRMANPEVGGDTPWDVVDELLAASHASIVDCGGEWLVRCGPPGSPVFNITDDDVLVDTPQDFKLHEGALQTYNAARVSHPNPNKIWKASESGVWKFAEAVTEDQGQIYLADLNLPAVFDRKQAKLLGRLYVKDSRRFRRHTITLPRMFANVQPLDVLAWTSTRNSYTSKRFEVFEVAHNLTDLSVTLSIKERDPNDYIDQAETDDPEEDSDRKDRVYPPLRGFSVNAVTIPDKDGDGRDPAIEVHWNRSIPSRRVQIQMRRAGTTNIRHRITTDDVEDGEHTIKARVHPKTDYEVRARGRNPRTGWTDWTAATSPNNRIRRKDLGKKVVGPRELAARSEDNDWPIWDLEEWVEPPSSDDPGFIVTGGTSSYAWLEGGNAQGAGHLRITRDGSTFARVEMWPEDAVPIRDAKRAYYVEFEGRTESGSNTGNVHPQIRWLNAQRTQIGTTNLSPNGNANLFFDTAYRAYSDRIRPPAGARFAMGSVLIEDGGPSTFRIDRFQFRKAYAEDLIEDGKVTGRHAKAEEWVRQRHARSNTTVNTPPPGSARKIIGLEIDLDGKTLTDIEFATVGDSLGNKVGGKWDFTATNFLQIWTRQVGTSSWFKVDEQVARYKSDDNPTIPIVFPTTETVRRLGRWYYEVRVYMPGSNFGCEVDYRHHHLRVGQKKK